MIQADYSEIEKVLIQFASSKKEVLGVSRGPNGIRETYLGEVIWLRLI